MLNDDIEITVRRLTDVADGNQAVLSAARQYALARGLDAPSGVERSPHSKPRFVPEGLSLSVSHSGEYWVCGIGAAPLGLDLQRHQPCRTQAIAKRFFHPSETAWLNGQGPDAFFQIWTAKESYVKYTGEGITDAFALFSTVDPAGRIGSCGEALLQHLPFRDGYTLCLCTKGKASVIFHDPTAVFSSLESPKCK